MITRCWELSKQRVNIALGLLLSLVFVYVSLEGFWTDSEMWAAVVVKYMFHDNPFYSFAIKPLFNLLLWFNFQWSLYLDLHPMVTGRFLMAINGLISAYLVSQILFLLTKDRWASALGFVLLLSFSTFVKRGGHVRSDLLVTTFVLAGVYFHILKNENKFLPFFLWSLVVLLSPKAVFFSIPLVGYLFSKSIFTYKKTFLYSLIFIMSSIFIFPATRLAAVNSWSFFVDQFTVDGMGFGYFSLIRFTHVIRFLEENFILLGFFIGSFFFYFHAGMKQSLPRVINLVSLIALLVFLIYPDRLPFLIASLLPFFTLFLVLRLYPLWKKKWVYGFVVVMCLSSFAYWSQDVVRYHSNTEQRLLADWLDQQFLTVPELTVWDPSGVLARSKADYFFLGPAQDKDNRGTLYNIKEQHTDIFLYTSKAFYLEPDVSAVLKLHYGNVGGGVFIRREMGGKVDEKRLNRLKKSIAQEMKNKTLTKLYRFDFEY